MLFKYFVSSNINKKKYFNVFISYRISFHKILFRKIPVAVCHNLIATSSTTSLSDSYKAFKYNGNLLHTDGRTRKQNQANTPIVFKDFSLIFSLLFPLFLLLFSVLLPLFSVLFSVFLTDFSVIILQFSIAIGNNKSENSTPTLINGISFIFREEKARCPRSNSSRRSVAVAVGFIFLYVEYLSIH